MISRRKFLATTSLLALRGMAWPDEALRAADTRPLEILIIRHAEKTEPKSDIHLNERGRARAEALVTLFPARFERPDFLVASHQSKLSNHAVETLQPLAKKLNLSIDDRFADDDYLKLVAALMQPAYSGAHVLICWHHETIPALAKALGASGVPAKWRDSVFDRVWRLRDDAGIVTFGELYQQLLPGDLRGPSRPR